MRVVGQRLSMETLRCYAGPRSGKDLMPQNGRLFDNCWTGMDLRCDVAGRAEHEVVGVCSRKRVRA